MAIPRRNRRIVEHRELADRKRAITNLGVLNEAYRLCQAKLIFARHAHRPERPDDSADLRHGQHR